MSKNRIALGIASLFIAISSVGLAEDASVFKGKYEKVDKELNRVYKAVMARLNDSEKKALKDSEKRWIEYKEYNCKKQKEILSSSPKDAEEAYYTCLYYTTDSRIEYLKAYLGEGVAPGIAGEYIDSFGGSIKLVGKGGKKFIFDISVVRGPSSHTGLIKGVAHFQGKNKAVFKDTGECVKDKEPCCILDFLFNKRRLEIKEKNCDFYRGMRAYFSGEYLKVK